MSCQRSQQQGRRGDLWQFFVGCFTKAIGSSTALSSYLECCSLWDTCNVKASSLKKIHALSTTWSFSLSSSCMVRILRAIRAAAGASLCVLIKQDSTARMRLLCSAKRAVTALQLRWYSSRPVSPWSLIRCWNALVGRVTISHEVVSASCWYRSNRP